MPAILLTSICLVAAATHEDKTNDDGIQTLFDGKTLEGWNGDSKVFRVEDMAIIGGQLKEKIP